MMTSHKHYEILCALASTGEISDKEIQELRFHLAECLECRKRLTEFGHLSAQVLPIFGERYEEEPVGLPSGMNERFVETARRHGLMLRLPAAPHVGYMSRLGPSALRISFVTAALVFVALFVTFHVRNHNDTRTVASQKELRNTQSTQLTHEQTSTTPPADSPSQAQSKTSAAYIEGLEIQIAKLKQDNAAADLNKDRLEARITALSADLAHAQQSAAQQAADIEAVNQQLALKRQLELQGLVVEAQNREQLKELRDQLGQRDEDVKRYQSLLSASEQARGLITARNLHIIDVHDANSSGVHQPPFGRIFYTEGKSLVFFAYDLPRSGGDTATMSFHVWGGELGREEAAKSLGIFRNEKNDGRWVLTCDDLHVLSQVNTVFVTVEKGHPILQKPSGKRILYAYLGDQPNHP